MENDNYTGFMALHTHPIINNLAQIKNIPKRTALDLFYNSNFYRLYERENTKLWHFSNVTLADLLNQEITTGHMDFPVEG